MFDLISIGDVVIDTFIPLTDAEVLKDAHQEMQLAVRFGDKVPVGPATSTLGGNAANNAIGSARLGLKTAIYTNVGEDADDQRIKNQFKREKVDIRYVVENRGFQSNHHIVLTYQGERTILVYHQPWKFNLPDLERSRWVYLTSLPPSFIDSNLMDQLVNFLERSGSRLAYNPGTFQIKMGVKRNPRLLSLTELFIVNKEEAKLVLGHPEGEEIEIKKLLDRLAALGPRNVVITDGKAGSYGFDGENYWKLEVFPAELVEMTGAGDAYSTGVVAGMIHGQNLSEAMRWGAANSASVVEQVGPIAGLLTASPMQIRLKKNSKIIAKKF